MNGLDDVARGLLERADHCLLSTHSARHAGFPFGTVVPFLLHDGRGVAMLMSGLAEHSKNLASDGRCSVLVVDPAAPGGDPQAAARVTVLGTARVLDKGEAEGVRGPYLARHPGAARLLEMGDFRFWWLAPEQSRIIEGFGRMGWLEGGAWLKGAPR